MPVVSVVMPSYNHERFISEAIESVLRQDFDDLELIIVDDASTDRSVEIIQRYAADDPRISVLLHEHNLGIAKTINDGTDHANGEFLAYTASDDVWIRDKLSKQLAGLESNEDLLVWTEMEVIDESGHPMGLTYDEFVGCVSAKKSGDIFHEILEGCFLTGSTTLFKRANRGDIRFDERLKYTNDWKFFLDLAAKYEFHYIAEPLVQYRTHANNTWGAEGPQGEEKRVAYQECILVREYALRQYPHRMSPEAKATELERLGVLYFALGQYRKALTSLSRAFTCSPFRRSNLQYPRRFFRFTQDALRGRL